MKLLIPTIEYADEIKAYREEMLKTNSAFDGTSSLKRFENPAQWIECNMSLMNKETVPDGLVQAMQFIYVHEDDNKMNDKRSSLF